MMRDWMAWSSADSGSSSSSIDGSVTSARASAARWRSPPETCAGRRSRISEMRNDCAMAETRRCRSSGVTRCRPYPMFSRTDMCGKSASLLEDVPDMAILNRDVGMCLRVEQHAVSNGDAAGIRFRQACEAAEQRGLSRARGAEEHRDARRCAEPDLQAECRAQSLRDLDGKRHASRGHGPAVFAAVRRPSPERSARTPAGRGP